MSDNHNMKTLILSAEMKKVLSDALGERLKVLFGFMATMIQPHDDVPGKVTDLDLLKEAEADLSHRLSVHNAIGFMSPATFESKEIEGEAKLKRIRAIIQLFDVMLETEKDLKEAKEKEKSSRDMERFFEDLL